MSNEPNQKIFSYSVLLTTQAQKDNEKIIPDYEEEGRYCLCVLQSETLSFSSIRMILI